MFGVNDILYLAEGCESSEHKTCVVSPCFRDVRGFAFAELDFLSEMAVAKTFYDFLIQRSLGMGDKF